MQRVHDGTVITLLTDKLPDSAATNYIKERKTTQVPKDQQKGKSFQGVLTVGEFPKVTVYYTWDYFFVGHFYFSDSKLPSECFKHQFWQVLDTHFSGGGGGFQALCMKHCGGH